MLFQSLILFHIIGLLMFAGLTIVEFIIFSQFDQDRIKTQMLLNATAKFHVFMRIGIGLIVLTGIGMMAMTQGVFGEQLWFRIKFALVVIIVLSSLIVGRRERLKIKAALEEGVFKDKWDWYHSIQLVLFFAIILLSVFKFN